MRTIEELIRVLLPLLPDAEVALDNDGQVVIYTDRAQRSRLWR